MTAYRDAAKALDAIVGKQNEDEEEEKQMKMILKDGKVFRFGTRKYANGDIYQGEFFNGKREGFGKLFYSRSGDKYSGEWEQNLCHGKGCYVSGDFKFGCDGSRAQGYRYEGEYRNGAKHGNGLEYCRNGDTYQGAFENNLYQGTGRLQKVNGDIIIGEFFKNHLSGKCKIYYKNGDRYFGQVQRDVPHGDGHFLYKSPGGSYQGQYSNGVFHGYGIRTFADGSIYSGNFVQGYMCGDGSLRRLDESYVGAFKNDLFHGRGVIAYANGDRFEGFFYQGIFYGRGKYTYADGSYYDGEYSSDAKSNNCNTLRPSGHRCGHGYRVWVSGNSYNGTWKNNQMHGNGIFIQAANESQYNGSFLSNLKHGYGEQRWGNQLGLKYRCGLSFGHFGHGFCRYQGEFLHDQCHGYGIHTCLDGRKYNGQWQNGMRHGQGSMILCPAQERGDPQRRFIGGIDGLYRAYRYDGPWIRNQRHGQNGILTMCDGTKYQGSFVHGQLHGQISVFFTDAPNNPKLALYHHGRRLYWFDEAPGSSKLVLKRLTKIIGRCVDAIHHAREEEAHLRAEERQQKRLAYEARKAKAKQRQAIILQQMQQEVKNNQGDNHLPDYSILQHSSNSHPEVHHDMSLDKDTQPTCALPQPRDVDSTSFYSHNLHDTSLLSTTDSHIMVEDYLAPIVAKRRKNTSADHDSTPGVSESAIIEKEEVQEENDKSRLPFLF